MLRSMYSGISGMKNFQTKLDVIGNNIANVNTYGFKKGRAVFKDLVSQQIAGANGPTGGGRGGVNPKQVGLGAQLSAIDTIHTEGSTQTTGRTLDLAISGDGFFQVNDGTNTYYTRAGNFYMDENGDLVNSDGFYLGAVGTPFNVPTTATSLSIGTDGTISYIDGTLNTSQRIEIAKFPNPEGLRKVGSNLYEVTDNSGVPVVGVPGVDGRGILSSGSLEMSNVDLSEEFTEMIVAQRGFQANTRIITTSDEILQELMNLKR
ncbi:flagellar basal body rod protein FlgG [Domibacillus aminovorans]|uniref:Flagellar basal-body rod protein FlgG n=1 Tax=Domibacillus aminovorans TaxID=29332 RepID=A0A177L9C2_9BACI|nr:flagellar basal body rod protein FlgG [Domibacillus aminovorans]OAH62084.1 flagellar basal-body rod protein FlgG [Domibacillus aminovorans]